MTRRAFGGDAASFVVTVPGASGVLTANRNAVVTMWSAQTGGSQYTDLKAADGVTSITSVTAGADGLLPKFFGPDNVGSMWANAPGAAERVLLLATDDSAASVVIAARAKVLLVGTSLEAQIGTGPETLDVASPGVTAVQARGYYHWLNAYKHQAFTLALNGGISGSLSAAQLATLAGNLASSDADIVIIGGPVNDPANDVDPLTTIANLSAMLDLCVSKKVLMLTCAPSSSYSTTARRQALAQVNDYIRSLTTTRSSMDLRVVDIWPLLADPATGSPAAGMSMDGVVHYSATGAERIGRAIAQAIDGWVPDRPPRVLGLLDPYNICGNPYFGSNGNGWALLAGGLATVTYPAADDRNGNMAVLSWSGVTDASQQAVQYIEPLSNGRYVAGDIVQASARLRWAGMVPVGATAVACMPFLRVWPRLADTTFGNPVYAMNVSSSEVPAFTTFPSSGDLLVLSSRITMPATVANLYIAIGWQGAASCTELRITDVVVRKGA